MIQFRALKPDEIQVRIQKCTAKGAVFLLYKDARCDMNILDETVGSENWQKEFYFCKDTLFCKVGINTNYNKSPDSIPNWVYKSDAGAESYTEKEKGEASDSFKRACVNWGIGRELYTKIFIFIPIETVQNGARYEPKNRFEHFIVSKIDVDKSVNLIKSLEISDSKGIVAFRWSCDV